MIAKNGRDLPIEQITSENYVVPSGEEHVYHVKIEVKQFNPKTGERISRPRIQKFGMKTWESSVRDSLRKQGYTMEILHDPNTWIAQNRAQIESLKAQNRESEKAALKAEILAELKASGIIPEIETTEKKAGRPKKD